MADDPAFFEGKTAPGRGLAPFDFAYDHNIVV